MSSLKTIFKPYLNVKTVYKGGKAAKEGVKTYKLSSNENPIGMSPKALEAIQKHSQNLHIYPDNTDKRLREALAKDFNYELAAEQFIAASSGSEIIDLTIRAFLREGDEIILCNPCFLPYAMFTKWTGSKVVDVPLVGSDYQLDVPGILAAITPKTRIIFLASPNNPSGTYIPRATLESLLDQLSDDIIVVYDEVYRHFADAEDYTTGLPYIKQGKNIIAVNSFSKTYGLAAMRIGFCYTTLEIANYIRQICKPFLLPKLSIEAGIAALEDKFFIGETVNLVQKERAFLASAFQELNIEFAPAQGNFFLIEPPIPDADFVNALYEKGVMVRPVTSFGAPGKVRISIGTREANEALIAAIKAL